MGNRFNFTDPSNNQNNETDQEDQNQQNRRRPHPSRRTRRAPRSRLHRDNDNKQHDLDENDQHQDTRINDHAEETSAPKKPEREMTEQEKYDAYEDEQDRLSEEQAGQGFTFQKLLGQARDKISDATGKDLGSGKHQQNGYDENETDKGNPSSQDQSKVSGFQQRQPQRSNGCLPKLIIAGVLIGGGWYGYHHFFNSRSDQKTQQTAPLASSSSKKGGFISKIFGGDDSKDSSSSDDNTVNPQTANKNQYKYPSERDTKYPSVYQITQVSVSLKDQKIYLMSKDKVLYTMLMTSGKNGTTPKGDFQIQSQQGKRSWSEQFKRGMNFWQSYKGDGQYVFSTIWTNKDGSYRTPDQNYLGVEPSTDNGNIQLSTPDARFIYSLVIGTPVHIY